MTSRTLLALALSSLLACHSHVDGTSVELVAASVAVDQLVDAEGRTLEVDRLELDLDLLELIFCEDGLARRMLRELLLPGRALAHHGSHGRPTEFEGPVTIDAKTGGEAVLGALEPPPGRYCAAMFVFGDARLEGQLGEAHISHALTLGTTIFVALDTPLELSSAQREGKLALRLDLRELLAEVDLEAATAESLAEALEAALPGAITAGAVAVEHAHTH